MKFILMITISIFLFANIGACCTNKVVYVDRLVEVYPEIPKLNNPDKIDFDDKFKKDTVMDINDPMFHTFKSKKGVIMKGMVSDDFYNLLAYYIQLWDRYQYYIKYIDNYQQFYKEYYDKKKDNDTFDIID